jgi:F-box interacting protein
VVFEILSWLPAKFLRRCRCVCTSWRALISDPAFIAEHRSRAEPLLVADSTRGGTMATTSVQIMDTDGYVVRLVDLGGLWTFRASLRDLVLVTSRPGHDWGAAIRVIDLASGGTILSCPGPAAEAADHVTTWFGFGRAARSGVLKVIRIVSRSFWLGHDLLTCEVLTVASGSGWRRTRSPPPEVCDSCDFHDGVAVDGVLHFLSPWRHGILCSDLASEEWTAIRGPKGVFRRKEEISLAELNGAVCMAHARRHTVNLWLLADTSKNVWVKAYKIRVDRVVHLPTDRVVDFVPLRAMRAGENLIFYYRPDYGSAAVLRLYDPRSGKCTDVENVPIGIDGRIGLCSSSLDPRLYM